MQLIDIGVNFHSRQLAPHTAALLERAKQANVVAILATGTSHASSRSAVELARSHSKYLFATAGVHPHSADSWTRTTVDELKPLWADPAVVAIGECGLDYNRNFSTPENQRRAFQAQLEAAARIKKPVFLHCRDAFPDFYAMLKEAKVAGVHGVVHCFTDGPAAASAFIDLGFDIGITGWVTDNKRGQALQAAVREAPLSRLHLETDAPYLGPKNHNNRRPYNEPANLPWIAKFVAELKGESPEFVAQQCTENSRTLFCLR